MDYSPLPPFGDRQLKLHTDSHYGCDDPIQWAQPYIPIHCHFAAIPLPQHTAQSLNHMVDTSHWGFQLLAMQRACVWFRETLSAKIQWTQNLYYFSPRLRNKILTIYSTSGWTKFSHYQTMSQVAPTSPWSTPLCPNVIFPSWIHCPRLAEDVALCLGRTWLHGNL